jgi:putative pyruvate formate lyase activating enzyme
VGAAPEPVREKLARMMLALQERGCHTINFVTPEHVVPQILEALLIAAKAGLRLPLVYNTDAYDSLESLRLMEGVVERCRFCHIVAGVYLPSKAIFCCNSHRYRPGHCF